MTTNQAAQAAQAATADARIAAGRAQIAAANNDPATAAQHAAAAAEAARRADAAAESARDAAKANDAARRASTIAAAAEAATAPISTPPARVAAALRRMGIDGNAPAIALAITAPWDDDSRPAGIGWITLDSIWAWGIRDAAVIAALGAIGIDAADIERPSDR